MKSTRKGGRAEASRLRLLVVDEGTLVTPSLMHALTDGGFRVELVADPDYALADTRGQRYDAVAINADSAEVNALWLSLALRVQGCPSVIMIIGEASSEADLLAAWRAGATDHVGHEMPREALVDRILAHIAGARIQVTGLVYPVTAELPTDSGLFTMSLVPTVVMLDDNPVSLTRIEERLFARLWAAKGAAVPPEELVASAWLGRKVSPATLQVHVSQLRRKLNKLGLAVERAGQRGYRLPSLTPPIARRNRAASRHRT
jgi:DNA-binding response OmpR family regulator